MGNCSPSARLNRLASSSIASDSSSSSLTSKRYDVYNVDARLFKHSKGQLQITNTHLVLYQKSLLSENSPPDLSSHSDESQVTVSWPLNSLRRYGYYKDIFLFESGRKSPTGEGLFAFKCHKAKLLNDNLHKIIFQNANSLYNTANGPQTPAEPPTPNTPSTPSQQATTEQNKPHYLNDTVVKSKPVAAVAKTPASPTNAEYVNDTIIAGANLVRLPLALSTPTVVQPQATAAAPKTQPRKPNQDYVNMSEVDANLLHLAQKLNSPKPPPPPSQKTNLSEYFKLNYFSILTGGGGNSASNGKAGGGGAVPKSNTNVSDSNVALNYIVPERIQIDNSNKRESTLSSSSPIHTSIVSKSEDKSQLRVVTSTNKSPVDSNSQYCVIDPKKTSAATKTRSAKDN